MDDSDGASTSSRNANNGTERQKCPLDGVNIQLEQYCEAVGIEGFKQIQNRPNNPNRPVTRISSPTISWRRERDGLVDDTMVEIMEIGERFTLEKVIDRVLRMILWQSCLNIMYGGSGKNKQSARSLRYLIHIVSLGLPRFPLRSFTPIQGLLDIQSNIALNCDGVDVVENTFMHQGMQRVELEVRRQGGSPLLRPPRTAPSLSPLPPVRHRPLPCPSSALQGSSALCSTAPVCRSAGDPTLFLSCGTPFTPPPPVRPPPTRSPARLRRSRSAPHSTRRET
ncbi:hypothetical protein B0H13DRAFT_2307854 [Mycena leptocephala]|nr:hypothetical protein B0H13DRAFT_2307854 [Mycena leptocephala]